MSSRKIYTRDFKLKVLEYYFKHGGDKKFGLKTKTANHFCIDHKTVSRMLCNAEIVKKARRTLAKKNSSGTSCKPPKPPSLKLMGQQPFGGNKDVGMGANSSDGTPTPSSSKSFSPEQCNMASGERKHSKHTSEVPVIELPEDPDFSLLKTTIDSPASAAANFARLLITGTKEVKRILSNECDLIFECKVCRNLFRSIINFLAHKRVYCQEENVNIKSLFHQDSGRNMSSESSTIVVEPEPPPLHPMEDPERNVLKIDRIASKLARQKKRSEAASKLSSSTDTGSSEYFNELEQVNELRKSRSSDCSVLLQDIAGVSSAVYQTFIPPNSSQCTKERTRDIIREVHQRKRREPVQLDAEGKVLKRNESSFILPPKISLPKEIEEQSKEAVFQCSSCTRSYPSKKLLDAHVADTHGIERTVYTCPICNMVFLSIWGCVKHLIRIHKKKKHQRERLKHVICSRAYTKLFTTKDIAKQVHKNPEQVQKLPETRPDTPAEAKEVVTRIGLVEEEPPTSVRNKGLRSRNQVSWECDVCSRIFLSKSACLAHRSSHHLYGTEGGILKRGSNLPGRDTGVKTGQVDTPNCLVSSPSKEETSRGNCRFQVGGKFKDEHERLISSDKRKEDKGSASSSEGLEGKTVSLSCLREPLVKEQIQTTSEYDPSKNSNLTFGNSKTSNSLNSGMNSTQILENIHSLEQPPLILRGQRDVLNEVECCFLRQLKHEKLFSIKKEFPCPELDLGETCVRPHQTNFSHRKGTDQDEYFPSLKVEPNYDEDFRTLKKGFSMSSLIKVEEFDLFGLEDTTIKVEPNCDKTFCTMKRDFPVNSFKDSDVFGLDSITSAEVFSVKQEDILKDCVEKIPSSESLDNKVTEESIGITSCSKKDGCHQSSSTHSFDIIHEGDSNENRSKIPVLRIKKMPVSSKNDAPEEWLVSNDGILNNVLADKNQSTVHPCKSDCGDALMKVSESNHTTKSDEHKMYGAVANKDLTLTIKRVQNACSVGKSTSETKTEDKTGNSKPFSFNLEREPEHKESDIFFQKDGSETFKTSPTEALVNNLKIESFTEKTFQKFPVKISRRLSEGNYKELNKTDSSRSSSLDSIHSNIPSKDSMKISHSFEMLIHKLSVSSSQNSSKSMKPELIKVSPHLRKNSLDNKGQHSVHPLPPKGFETSKDYDKNKVKDLVSPSKDVKLVKMEFIDTELENAKNEEDSGDFVVKIYPKVSYIAKHRKKRKVGEDCSASLPSTSVRGDGLNVPSTSKVASSSKSFSTSFEDVNISDLDLDLQSNVSFGSLSFNDISCLPANNYNVTWKNNKKKFSPSNIVDKPL